MIHYIDIHTHRKDAVQREGVFQLISARSYDTLSDPDRYYSWALHPWDSAHSDTSKLLEFIVKKSILSKTLAIGETGIDALRGATQNVQIEIFTFHAKLAEACQKPLIIHCVRAWSEVLAIRKQVKPRMAWIVHGFRGKESLAQQLLQAGFYLSVGAYLLQSPQWAHSVFRGIPPTRLFLETDDSGAEIGQIYEVAATAYQIPLGILAKTIETNWRDCFHSSPVFPTNIHP